MLTKIKIRLKQNRFIFELNGKYKCYKIKKQFQKIIDYYSNKKIIGNFEELLKRKGFTKELADRFKYRKPRVFYLGTDEYQDKSGFLQALEKYTEVDIFYEDSSYGHAKFYSEVYKRKYSNRLKYLINNSLKKYDILLMQAWGSSIDVNTILELKNRFHFKVINISMDDRHTFWVDGKKTKGTAELIPALDLMLVTSPESVEWYHKEGIPALFFQEASSPDFFFPMNLEKRYEVGFVGAKYGIREKIVTALKQNNIIVQTYGSGWENGRLPLENTNRFFNECKIVLGVGTVGYCEDFYSLKLRDFDAPMSGVFYITHDNKDLNELYRVDKEIVTYRTVNECVEKVKYYLKNDSDREYIAKAGYNRAIKEHTWEKRFDCLFRVLKIM